MQFGDLEIHLLSDGRVQADPGGPYGLVPRVLYQEYVQPDKHNKIPEALTCLLIRADDQWILVDNGLGEKVTEKEAKRWGLTRPGGGIRGGLLRLGLKPEDINIVIDTHLHWDHAGGNTCLDGDEVVPTFKNAIYYVQRMEWAEASFPDARTRGTYFADNFEPLFRSGQLSLLHGDTQIAEGIFCVVTPGHTRGHQCVLLNSGGRHGLFVSDMASHAVHMQRTAWLTSFDVLPLENIRTKQRWQAWAVENEAWLFFQHDPVLHVAQLREIEGRLDLREIEEAAPLATDLPTPELPLE